jgi:hypothetical protein
MRASGGADEYVQLRRYAVWILENLDRALGSSLFEPADEPTQDESEHDPGIVLVELLAEVGDALSDYADRVAAEERLRTRRYAVAAAAALLVASAWWRRRRC